MPVIEKSSNFTVGGNARLYEIHGDGVIHQGPDADELERDQAITNLPRVQASRKDYETNKKSGPCFPGTRKALLQEMMDWVTHRGESKMYALSGLAGIGKTTVAYTIATEADKRDLLGASFFFSRDEADRRSAKKFFTTIAYHLCRFNEEFAQAIAGMLVTKDGYSATTGSPQEQLETLILDPLRAIDSSNTPQTLIIVDALDECDDEDAPSVLTGLWRIVQTLPSFKVILTTRPQPLVDNDFSTQGSHKIFHLQDIEEKIVNEDLRLYLQHSFSCEQVRTQLRSRTMEWSASGAQIESLIQASGKLFIMASMAVRYILDRHWTNPASRINTLLDAFAQGHTPFENLVDFYTIILRSAIPADCRDASLINRYQAIVGTILFTHVPLSIYTLARLIGIEVEQIFVVLRQLQSAILVGKDDIPVICHKSFADYITDSTRCMDDNMRIDPKVCHMWITTCCFKIMNQELKYNILSLGIPARFMNNKEGLANEGLTKEQLQEMILQHVRYACVYWGNHLEVANVEDADLLQELEEFIYHHMMHWFEALSLIEKLDIAHRAIRVALKRLTLKPASSKLLSDAQRFVSKFYETIERSALHTYYSALAFTPADSPLYRLYIKHASHDVCDIKGVPEKWDPLIAHLDHGEYVNNIRFSLDSTMFVSFGEGRGTLKVWDAGTGTPISTIKGSLGGRFAIANDFATIASYKDDIIILYNMNGSEQGVTFTAEAMIHQVAISSENSRVAAGSSDGTLYLWDTGNGKLVGSFDDYQSDSGDSHLAFSAAGARLAYRSINGVVKLRNGSDGGTIADLNWGRGSEEVQLVHVAFSRDGSRIGTLSKSGQLKLWSCQNGKLVGIAKNGLRGHRSLAISADGSLLATGFENIFGDWKVRLWSENSGKPRLSRVVDSLDVDPKSIAFSPDNTLAVATPNDVRLYNITVTSRTFVSALPCYVPTFLAFSPDGSRLAAEGSSGTVYLWDIQGIKTSSPSSNDEASSQVTALALSQDCSQVACGFRDGAIELRETGSSAKQRTAAHWALWGDRKWVEALRFSSDGRQFASCLDDGTIKLWKPDKGKGLRKTLKRGSDFYAVEVSTSLLAAVHHDDIVFLDSMKLDLIHTFAGEFWRWTRLSFSADGAFLAAVNQASAAPQIFVFDVTKRTTIATFDVSGRVIHSMAFSPDNSQLIVLFDNDNRFLTFNLVNEELPKQPTLEDLIRLPNMPLWNGVPVWVSSLGNGEQYYLAALFPQHDVPVPVLWIPRELGVEEWAEGRSMIALGCEDGRVILLRLPTSVRD